MTKVYIATLLNWFLPGLGWMILNRRPALGGVLVAGASVLTLVELRVQTAAPELYWVMFAAVLVINTALAIDCYLEGAAKVAAESPAATPAA